MSRFIIGIAFSKSLIISSFYLLHLPVPFPEKEDEGYSAFVKNSGPA